MQFHILDENYIPVAVMDNELPESIHYQKSKFHQFLTGSANFFDFETSKLHVDSDKFQVGYWIAFRYDDRDRLLYIDNIAEAERDKMMTISSISDNLDLNNETIQPFAAPEAKPFKWYFDKIMFDTGYEIGINEISNLTRKISWDSEMTIRNFIQSVATQFDNAELDYEVKLNSDFSVKKRLIHIKKQIGEVREDIELRYNENIKTIKRTTSTSGLYTAIRPVSRDNNAKIIDISSMPDWEKKDENGNVKFFHKKGSTLIFAPQANARFGNRGANITGGGYIVYDFSHDNISQSELFNRAAKYLEDHSVPAVNYLAEGKTDAKIGDTVKMVNDGYTPQLLTSARVLEKVASFDDDSIERAEFGNYKALQSQISADLIAKMQQLAEENAPYKVVTLTTNGLTFKNSEGSTTLTARLYKGSKEIVPESYDWTIDGVVISGSSEQHEITAEDIDGKAVVRWSAVINGNVVAFDEVTIVDVSDGKQGTDGKTYYPHTAWAYRTSKIVLPNTITASTEYQLEYTSTTSNVWMQLNFGGVADSAQVDFDVKIEVENLTNPVKYAYMGTYSDYTATDSTVPTNYTWSRILGADGADGIAGKDGKGIKATAIAYQASTNGATAPTGTWSASVPTVAKGSFLWTRTIWTYTDNTTETGYAVAYMGTNGNNGTDGIAGKDGVGIRTTTITYAGSTSGTTAPSTGWTTAVPTVPAGSYLWTKTVWDYTDNTSETGYSVAMMGAKGDKGDPTGITKSATEPENKFDGMIWYVDSNVDVPSANMQVGSVAQSHGQYTWNGTKWSLYMLRSINMRSTTDS